MKVSEVKSLFLAEFAPMGMSMRDMRYTWYSFIEDLFQAGSINYRVYERCNALNI